MIWHRAKEGSHSAPLPHTRSQKVSYEFCLKPALHIQNRYMCTSNIYSLWDLSYPPLSDAVSIPPCDAFYPFSLLPLIFHLSWPDRWCSMNAFPRSLGHDQWDPYTKDRIYDQQFGPVKTEHIGEWMPYPSIESIIKILSRSWAHYRIDYITDLSTYPRTIYAIFTVLSTAALLLGTRRAE